MVESIHQLCWAIAPSLIVGIFMAIWNKKEKRRDERAKTREEARLKSERLRISLLFATAQLSYAVAMAIKRGAPNGEIEAGIEEYNKALNEFREFERTQIVNM